MSQNKNDEPKTGHTGKNPAASGLKPRQGELFMRTADGSVLLGQTMRLFGIRPGS